VLTTRLGEDQTNCTSLYWTFRGLPALPIHGRTSDQVFRTTRSLDRRPKARDAPLRVQSLFIDLTDVTDLRDLLLLAGAREKRRMGQSHSEFSVSIPRTSSDLSQTSLFLLSDWEWPEYTSHVRATVWIDTAYSRFPPRHGLRGSLAAPEVQTSIRIIIIKSKKKKKKRVRLGHLRFCLCYKTYVRIL